MFFGHSYNLRDPFIANITSRPKDDLTLIDDLLKDIPTPGMKNSQIFFQV